MSQSLDKIEIYNDQTKRSSTYDLQDTSAQQKIKQLQEQFEQPVQEQVNNWLNEHPEATTTVQDGSLTIDKMVIGTLGYVTPEMFGAKGDGVSDDTGAFTTAFNLSPIELRLQRGKTYKVNNLILNLKNDIKIIGEPGATLFSETGDCIKIIGGSKIEISGLVFKSSVGSCILFSHESRNALVTVHNCSFVQYLKDAIDISSPTGYLTIEECIFSGTPSLSDISIGRDYKSSGISPNYIYINKCYLANISPCHIYVGFTEWLFITNCNFGNSKVAVDIESEYFCRNITISGNQFVDCENAITAIKASGNLYDMSVINNKISNYTVKPSILEIYKGVVGLTVNNTYMFLPLNAEISDIEHYVEFDTCSNCSFLSPYPYTTFPKRKNMLKITNTILLNNLNVVLSVTNFKLAPGMNNLVTYYTSWNTPTIHYSLTNPNSCTSVVVSTDGIKITLNVYNSTQSDTYMKIFGVS